MLDDPVISIGSSQREWAGQLARFVSDYGGARIRGTVLTVDDALQQDYQILIVDDIASYLTPRFVEQVQRHQRKILGIYDPDLGASSKDRLLALGVDAVLDAFATPEEMLRAVHELADLGGLGVGDTEEAPVEPSPTGEDPFQPLEGPVVVAGGDPAIDVALALADAMIGSKRSAVVVDADTAAPSLAQRLGMPVAPNLLTATDSFLQLRGSVDDSIRTSPRGFGLLAGIPTADEWDSVQPRDVADLIEYLIAGYREVIVKVGTGIEDLAPMTGRVGRFDVARTLVTTARQVVVVSAPTPLGLARLLTWLAHLRRLSGAAVHVVFTDAPRSAYQRGELSEELVRSFVPVSITWLPRDGRQQRAVWNGELVSSGSYMRAMRGLAARLLEHSAAGAQR